MNSVVATETVVWACRFALGATLVLSGAAKLRDIGEFERGLAAYRLLPESLIAPIARLVPPTELLLGLLIALGVLPRLTGVFALVLLLAFAAAVAVNLRRGRTIPCHCFGASARDTIGAATLIRLGMLMATAVVVLLQPGALELGAGWMGLPPLAILLPALCVAIAMVLILMILGPAERIWQAVRAARARDLNLRQVEAQRSICSVLGG